jgi:CRP-like cAMP-binding protein
MYELLLQNVARHIRLDPEEEKHFTDMLEAATYKSRQVVLQEGHICRNTIFVRAGCLRGFTTDKNGYEHVLNFAPPGWWMADLYSLISGRPGTLSIQALEKTEVLLLPKNSQEQLYREVPKFERFFRILAENSLVNNQQRLLDNMSLSAEERYDLFCKKYPSLIQCLAQKQIASYIGVTPEFFSKMRARMMRGA